MAKGIRLLVWGDYALFTRPEMKVERVSYDFITPSAARNLLQSIYWKPQINWVIDSIHILNPIVFTSVRRNEVGKKAILPNKGAMSGETVDKLQICADEERQQRASLVLKNVQYLIEAHFDILQCTLEKDGPIVPEATCAAKHSDMFRRRAEAGQAFQQPYLGCREFPAYFRLLKESDPIPPCTLPDDQRNKDFGYVFHDFLYTEDPKGKIVSSNTHKKLSAEAKFFRAIATNGVIRVPALSNPEVVS